jgi:hypothetical protein
MREELVLVGCLETRGDVVAAEDVQHALRRPGVELLVVRFFVDVATSNGFTT